MTAKVVSTNRARCRDCYRCLRACPVKAIRLQDGQAEVVPERCVDCGHCTTECPQKARFFRSDLEHARALVAQKKAVVSVAPALAGFLSPSEWSRLPSALRLLGFEWVSETSVGAWHVAQAVARIRSEECRQPAIATACPAAVRYIQLYHPEAARWLLPVASPMVTHGRLLKEAHPDAAVVFIGPCVAKKAEADAHPEVIDCVLTYTELTAWLEDAGLKLSHCEESGFDDTPGPEARFFPLPGGLLKTAGLDVADAETTLAVGGFEDLDAALCDLVAHPRPIVLEPLFCRHGCLDGPAAPTHDTPFARRRRLKAFAQVDLPAPPLAPEAIWADQHLGAPIAPDPFNDEDIRRTLEETGKGKAEDRLDCGSCGYDSCRDKAIAVLRGLAEPEMCMPLMRRFAEQRTDRIIETSPNGIVILDDRNRILHMNPTFRRLFHCTDAVIGRPISYLMDAEPFEALARGEPGPLRRIVRHPAYSLVCHQLLYRLDQERQTVGIFVDITEDRARKETLDRLRAETIAQANELLTHQVQMAQDLARFLGESTARGEVLVEKLLELAGEPGSARDPVSWAPGKGMKRP